MLKLRLDKWTTRGATVKVKLINGDYFPHAYIAVDFGGLRGWENTFHSTIPINGAGPWFTFGRAWWEMNTPVPSVVPAAISGLNPNVTQKLPKVNRAKILKAKEFLQTELDPFGTLLPVGIYIADKAFYQWA